MAERVVSTVPATLAKHLLPPGEDRDKWLRYLQRIAVV